MHCGFFFYYYSKQRQLDNCVPEAKGCTAGRFEKLHIGEKQAGGVTFPSCALTSGGGGSQPVICHFIRSALTSLMTNFSIMTAPPWDFQLFINHICAQLQRIIQTVEQCLNDRVQRPRQKDYKEQDEARDDGRAENESGRRLFAEYRTDFVTSFFQESVTCCNLFADFSTQQWKGWGGGKWM